MIKTVAIIGAGLTGGVVAQTLRDEGFAGDITVYGDETLQPYDRPALSKAALLEPGSGPTDLFPSDWADKRSIKLNRGVKVQRIDPVHRRIFLDDGQAVNADRIVLATGSRARGLPRTGADLDGVHMLRTWDDTIRLRDAIRPGARLVVIGGGLIGCEIATTATKIGAKVTLIEAGSALLERVLGRDVGNFCRGELEGMGISILVDTNVSWIEGSERVHAVCCDGDRRIEADLVLVCIGAEPAAELARDAGLECCGGGIIVDAFGLTSSPNVYAAGDVACWPLRDGGQRCLETYLNSQGQAETVARAILGKAEPALQVPKSWTEIAGHRIQIVGDIVGPGQIVLRRKGDDGPSVYFRVGQDGSVSAAITVDAPADFAVAVRMVEGRFQPALGELGDATVPLKKLLRPKT